MTLLPPEHELRAKIERRDAEIAKLREEAAAKDAEIERLRATEPMRLVRQLLRQLDIEDDVAGVGDAYSRILDRIAETAERELAEARGLLRECRPEIDYQPIRKGIEKANHEHRLFLLRDRIDAFLAKEQA